MSERVSVARHAGVADVRLNRPDKLNGLDAAMFEALAAGNSETLERTRVRYRCMPISGFAGCTIESATQVASDDEQATGAPNPTAKPTPR